MKIILASESPRRRELLEMMGLKFDIKPSNSDETFKEGLSIEEQSKRLAHIKAKSVFDDTSNEGDRAVIGSDTMVIEGDKIYGKPHTREQAIEMLQDLIITCINDAMRKVDSAQSAGFGKYNIPGLM